MNSLKFVMILLFVFASCSVSGCGSDGNTVIEPEVYEPTEAEKENAKRMKEEMARQTQE